MIRKCYAWSDGPRMHIIFYTTESCSHEFDLKAPTTPQELEDLEVGFSNIVAWLENEHRKIGTPYEPDVAPPSP